MRPKEMWDFAHTTAFTYAKNPTLIAGDYADSANSDIVVITAGAQLQKDQTRDDLVRINARVIRSVIADVGRYSPGAIVIVVTNPVDVMTRIALDASDFPAGTSFRPAPSSTRRVSCGYSVSMSASTPRTFSATSSANTAPPPSFPGSLCNVCGLDVDRYCQLNGIAMNDKTRCPRTRPRCRLRDFPAQGHTNHGIAAVARIIRAIEANERSVLPVGVLLRGHYGSTTWSSAFPASSAAKASSDQPRVPARRTHGFLEASAAHVGELIRLARDT